MHLIVSVKKCPYSCWTSYTYKLTQRWCDTHHFYSVMSLAGLAAFLSTRSLMTLMTWMIPLIMMVMTATLRTPAPNARSRRNVTQGGHGQVVGALVTKSWMISRFPVTVSSVTLFVSDEDMCATHSAWCILCSHCGKLCSYCDALCSHYCVSV